MELHGRENARLHSSRHRSYNVDIDMSERDELNVTDSTFLENELKDDVVLQMRDKKNSVGVETDKAPQMKINIIIIIVIVCNCIAGIIAYSTLIKKINASHIVLTKQMIAHMSVQKSHIDKIFSQIQDVSQNCSDKAFEDRLQPFNDQLRILPELTSNALKLTQLMVTSKLNVIYNATSNLIKNSMEFELAMKAQRQDHFSLQVFKYYQNMILYSIILMCSKIVFF
jgi:hypothetical protein